MLLMSEAVMEKRTETSQQSSRTGRVTREPSPSAKERKTKAPKSVKLQEPHKRKEKTEEEEERAEAKEAQINSSSTVVNVDSVRERIKEDREELLGLLETEGPGEALKKTYLGVCELLLIVFVLSVVIFFFPISIWFCVKIVREHERAVKFRLGHLLQKRPRGPGLMFYLPFLDVCHIVDIRLKILKIPPHTVVTKDLVCTEALAQVSVREVLARHAFTDILLDRKRMAREIQVSLDSVTCRWGINVERAEIEEIHLPPELQRNFAVEAEARRQAQVKVISAEGEKAACEALKASVESLSGSPLAVHLRLLQLLNNLRSEQPAVVLNIPSDVLTQSINLTSLTRPANQGLTAGDGSDDANKDSPMM
ncbi:podocin isoform X2 [Puntigrus tetrazona]|uniref:podocin isoform X2 n=1 Tax=Puntigrus tetrazona TaxID=1606681 RepID=UPI001C89A697|nr:podocin isoform X2 [Puntigrus tetrazona]